MKGELSWEGLLVSFLPVDWLLAGVVSVIGLCVSHPPMC